MDGQGRTLLHAAAESGDFACVQLLFQQHPTLDPNARAQAGITPLMLAARCQNMAVVRRLIEAGAVVDQPSDQGHTALMEAAQCGSTGVVEALLAAGADATATSPDGWSALDGAVVGGHQVVVERLLAGGAVPTANYHLCQGFQSALQGLYAEAMPWFSAALELTATAKPQQQFTVDDWMIETPHALRLARACLAECELKCGNHEAARQHYQQLRQSLPPTGQCVIAVRVWPSPASHLAGRRSQAMRSTSHSPSPRPRSNGHWLFRDKWRKLLLCGERWKRSSEASAPCAMNRRTQGPRAGCSSRARTD